jgi:hypothetical protein
MPVPMPSPPPTDQPPAPRERLEHLRESYDTLPRARRELIIYGAAVLLGVLVMPLLVWTAGNRILGPYTHGEDTHAGPLALLGDFFLGLAHGSAVFWAVALGPALLVLLLRGFFKLLQALPGRRD